MNSLFIMKPLLTTVFLFAAVVRQTVTGFSSSQTQTTSDGTRRQTRIQLHQLLPTTTATTHLRSSGLTSDDIPTTDPESQSTDSLISAARQSLAHDDTDTAFTYLAQAQSKNPQAVGLQSAFEDVFRTRIRIQQQYQQDDSIDRIGLGCLLLERGKYAEAATQFQNVVENNNNNQQQKQTLDDAYRDRAICSLFKARAAICDWNTIEQDSQALVESVHSCLLREEEEASTSLSQSTSQSYPIRVPSVHPYESLMWPCFSIQDATNIAAQYGKRAMSIVGRNANSYARTDFQNLDYSGGGSDSSSSFSSSTSSYLQSLGPSPSSNKGRQQNNMMLYRNNKFPKVMVEAPLSRSDGETSSLTNSQRKKKKTRVGYISPDFTGKHPLAFLMQDVFRFHNREEFDIYIYSLMEEDSSVEVQKIKHSCNEFKVLTSPSSYDAAQTIQQDELDVLVDYTLYVGLSVGAEIMAYHPAKIQISHMGFPASSGAPFIDYLVCDETVVPPSYRHYYTENLLYMPHCFFANSHRYLDINTSSSSSSWNNEDTILRTSLSRAEYGLPETGFVFCCHNRPEKLDPKTFASWLRVLQKVPNSVLWLLSTGKEMENNLLQVAASYGSSLEGRLIFSDMVPRDEHLKRLQQLADLFLDTPAYNAHTTGCDCLIAGVPMVSLLRPCTASYSSSSSSTSSFGPPQPNNNMVVVPKGEVLTEKIASRVGGSFLKTLHLEELIADSLQDYENIMIRCATDPNWFAKVKHKLNIASVESPLFDTERWVNNWEAGLREIISTTTTNPNYSRGGCCDIYVVERK